MANSPHIGPNLARLLTLLPQQDAVLVTVGSTQGSVPRESGAWMAVTVDEVLGTIGGGHLEWASIAAARQTLQAGERGRRETQVALGPSLGQCCGGRLTLVAEVIGRDDIAALPRRLTDDARPVALFGGGHVGQAIVRALAPLPYRVHWVDSRDGVFPSSLSSSVQAEHSDPVQAAVADLAPGSRVLVMSFSHAEDLDVVAACLQRQRQQQDLPFIGLIGSKTKWARFAHRLEAQGFAEHELAQVTCPIGLPGITGKAPEVIAASVVAQLLLLDSESPTGGG